MGAGHTLFHELVHVVQYRKLGLSDFAARYVTEFLRGGSYQQIPLEINSYQLDAEYTQNPKRQFAVEERLQVWIKVEQPNPEASKTPNPPGTDSLGILDGCRSSR